MALSDDNRLRRELTDLKNRIEELERFEQDRLEAEKALRRSEAKYRGLFEHILEGVYQTYPDGTIMSANPALVKMLGYASEKELCAKATAKKLYVDPEERRALLRKLDKDGVLRNVEFELRRKDGKTICVLENARVVREEDKKSHHYEGVLTDITSRKQTELELKKAHERLEATLDALPDILFTVDKKGTILDFRAPEPELLAVKPESFLGKTVRECLPKKVATVVMGAIGKASKKGKHIGAVYSLETDGRTGWFELSIAAQGDYRKKDCLFVALVRDITARKNSEDKLREKTDELERERKTLAEKNITLKNILEQIDRQRRDIQTLLYRDFEKEVIPLLNRLKRKADSGLREELDILSRTIDAVLARDSDEFKLNFSRLTSRESEICDYIKNGMSSKEISEKLSISTLTVAKHREKIRHKLGLAQQGMSLATFLRSHS